MTGLIALLYGCFLGGIMTAFVFLGGGVFQSGSVALIVVHLAGAAAVWFAVRAYWRTLEVFPEDRLVTGVMIPIPLLALGFLILQSQPLILHMFDARATAALGGWVVWVAFFGFVSAVRGATPETE